MQKKYKHYSFDLWLTLIRSNPEFKKKRAEYFAQHFNPNKLSVEQVEAVIRKIDKMGDSIAELTGLNVDALQLYVMVLSELGYNLKGHTLRDIQAVYHMCNSLFFQYPPVLYDADTKSVLDNLYSSGATLSILSNTGFIKGGALKRLLKDLHIYNRFSFMLFSDELGICKPNPTMFLNMVNAVHAVRIGNPVMIGEIIHVGDNKVADGAVTLAVGIDTLIINSTDKTIKDLL